MGSACVGLMSAAPGRPVQAVDDSVFALVNEVEQSADFGEGERDQASMKGWCGFWLDWLVGWAVVLSGWPGVLWSPFLVV